MMRVRTGIGHQLPSAPCTAQLERAGAVSSPLRDSIMRSASVGLIVFLLSAACFAQQSGDTPITVSGCMIGMNGSFKLSTHEGEIYVLKGDHSTLFSYNGMLVEVTGTVKSSKKSQQQVKPGTIHVTKVKKLADSCQ